jgi:hypothetical protein
MGLSYKYSCAACGYETVVGGGKQIGMRCVAWTITCHDCRKLVDVVVSDTPWDHQGDWQPMVYSCPDKKAHRVSLWKSGGSCPKCSEPMEQDSSRPELLWD